MIENFRVITENGYYANVWIGGELFYREDQPEENILKAINSPHTGIEWTNNGETISKFLPDTNIKGYPSLDQNYIIAIYMDDKSEYKAPNNAVVYNSKGNFHTQLTVPKLISKLAKDKIKDIQYDPPYPNVVRFDDVGWGKDSSGNNVINIRIVFDMYYFEERALNPTTGEFGECLGSGRF